MAGCHPPCGHAPAARPGPSPPPGRRFPRHAHSPAAAGGASAAAEQRPLHQHGGRSAAIDRGGGGGRVVGRGCRRPPLIISLPLPIRSLRRRLSPPARARPGVLGALLSFPPHRAPFASFPSLQSSSARSAQVLLVSAQVTRSSRGGGSPANCGRHIVTAHAVTAVKGPNNVRCAERGQHAFAFV